MNAIVKFQEKELELVNIDGNAYMRSSDVARALAYERADFVSRIYERNKDEFTDEMSLTVKLTVKGFGGGNSKKPVRVFNMRGCHLIAMLSDTPVAKAFRAWCLDILEGKIVLPFGNKQPRAVTPVDLAAIGGTVKRCVAKVMREELSNPGAAEREAFHKYILKYAEKIAQTPLVTMKLTAREADIIQTVRQAYQFDDARFYSYALDFFPRAKRSVPVEGGAV